MIKITNNIDTKVVTQGAYENFYKPLGFTIVENKKPTIKEETKVLKEEKEEVVEDNKKDEVVDKKESLKETKENFKRK